MKKVLIFHHCGDIGGAGISLINTVLMLKETYEVVVYSENGPIVDKLLENGIRVKIYEKPFGAISSYSGSPKICSRTYLKKLLQIFDTNREIVKIINFEDPQIVVNNSITTAYVASITKKLNSSIKVVSFIRETFRADVGTKVNIKFLSKYTDQIFFITKRDLTQYNIQKKEQEVIYNSIDLNSINTDDFSIEKEYKEIGERGQKFRVLYLGGDSPIKGWSFMKELISKKSPDILFLIAGKCKESITENNAIFIGVQDSLDACMFSADVLLFPVAHPHQGRPLFEAGAYKVPVIVPDFDVFNEAVIENKNGLRYTPFDAKDCLQKINYLKEHPVKLKEMGQENWRLTLENHSFEKNKTKLLSIFNAL